MANVKEVEWQGGIYNITDETARGEARQAHALANTAQASANAAQTTANAAQTAADNAQTTANAAGATANAAQTTANAAQTAVSALSPRVSNIESALAIKTFQVSIADGLPEEPGYTRGVKSGNVVSIRVGIRSTPLLGGEIIATLPEGTRPQTDVIQDTVTSNWKTGSHVEISPAGIILLREASEDGIFFTATYIS